MALTGKAKTDYMRGYMRKRRGTQSQDAPGSTISVRPDALDPPKKALDPVRPKASVVRPKQGPTAMPVVKVQHTNPMMVGYEPPR
jgi:hypothetical protein